jgi:hypothetical protein
VLLANGEPRTGVNLPVPWLTENTENPHGWPGPGSSWTIASRRPSGLNANDPVPVPIVRNGDPVTG